MSKKQQTKKISINAVEPQAACMSNKAIRRLAMALVAVFAVFATVLLATGYGDYMSKIDSLSLFVSTTTFFIDCMRTPGGLVIWLSTLLTQTMYYPLLGAVTYTVVLCLLWLVVSAAVRLPRRYISLGIVPVSLCLLLFVSFGYSIFSQKVSGYAYSLPVGLSISMLLVWVYRSFNNILLRCISLAIIVIAGYPLLGCFALYAAMVCAVYQVAESIYAKSWISLSSVAVAALLVWLVPYLWMSYVTSDLYSGRRMLSPLPMLFDGEDNMKLIYQLTFASVAMLALLHPLWSPKASAKLPKVCVALIIYLASIACIVLCSPHDDNFRLTLSLDRALWRQDWNSAVQALETVDYEPTRLNMLLGDIAMMRTDVAPDRMYRNQIACAEYQTPRYLRVMHEGGAPLISYLLGLTNEAYRWSMENLVELGPNVEQLQLMAKCAILDGNEPLARKYLSTLSHTTFHRQWAQKYGEYVDNPALVDADPEMAVIRQLQNTNNQLTPRAGVFEGWIWPYLASAEADNPTKRELVMLAAMMNQDMPRFAAEAEQCLKGIDRIPRHYQEALLILRSTNHDFDISGYNIDPQVVSRFNNFMADHAKYANQGDATLLRALYPQYGDTYWYYFIYYPYIQRI